MFHVHSASLSKKQLITHFEKFGPVEKLIMNRSNTRGVKENTGFVVFNSEQTIRELQAQETLHHISFNNHKSSEEAVISTLQIFFEENTENALNRNLPAPKKKIRKYSKMQKFNCNKGESNSKKIISNIELAFTSPNSFLKISELCGNEIGRFHKDKGERRVEKTLFNLNLIKVLSKPTNRSKIHVVCFKIFESNFHEIRNEFYGEGGNLRFRYTDMGHR